MRTFRLFFALGAALPAALFACGSSNEAVNPVGPASDAGADASSDAAQKGDAAEASTPDAAPNDAGADAGAARYGLFLGSNLADKAELAVYDLRTQAFAGRVTVTTAAQASDSVVTASGDRGFVLFRKTGQLQALQQGRPWIADKLLDVNDTAEAGDYGTNPQAIVVGVGTKAYVARLGLNTVKVVDVGTGRATGTIDFAQFLASGDPDGRVDIADAVYDASKKRVYFLLQRVDQYEYGSVPPDYIGVCKPFHGMVVGIDANTDALVDMNGAGAGLGAELLGANPQHFYLDGDRLLVVDVGCIVPSDGGSDAGVVVRDQRGVEQVNVATGAASWLLSSTAEARIDALLYLDGTHAYLHQGDWFAWDPTNGALGPKKALPQSPVYDRVARRILGLQAPAADAGTADGGAGFALVSWDPATEKTSTVATSVFASVVPSSWGLSSAIAQ